jgi:radical SAM family uncharacterized protein/radical SAM-linked protein
MTRKGIQAILSQVEKPCSYIGTEINAIHKDLSRVKLRIALAFPDLYEIGTSHFGVQILYHILNRREDIAVERVFAPGLDLEAQLRRQGLPLFSLESQTPIGRFHILGFSLLYELSYSNVLCMLDLAGIPLAAAERSASDPLVIAGGPCTCNPEPMAEFFDAMVIGDGEEVLSAMADAWLAWRQAGGSRERLLEAWAEIPGVYVPRFFIPSRDRAGFQVLSAAHPSGAGHVSRAVVGRLHSAHFPERPVVPFGKPVHDRLRLEIARGCSRGCRFCQAGMIYRPVRERSPGSLLALAQSALDSTGYEELSLLSLSSGDYSAIHPLMAELAERFAGRCVALSLPSLRAGSLTPELMQAIRRVRKTGFTIAPEAGSQRLRNVINKNIDDDQIRQTVVQAFAHGWNLIKLYFMVGLPTETPADLEATVRLVRQLRHMVRSGPRGRRAQINISVGTFIPKAHTPFQWCAQLSIAEATRRINWLRERFRFAGLQFKWQNPAASYLEGLFARGDRRLSGLLRCAYRKGARFDGWSDRFDWRVWLEAMEESGIDAAFFVERDRPIDEPLPWDHIRSGVAAEFLRREYADALVEATTPDCRDGNCQGCGVCDFQRLAPRLAELPPGPPENIAAGETSHPSGAEFRAIGLQFHKTGSARFLGHLDVVNVFTRALRRAGIGLRYSQGFHPKPKMRFEDALPIGLESLDEWLHLQVDGTIALSEVVSRLNAQLPSGLRVVALDAEGEGRKAPAMVRYSIQAPVGEEWDPQRVDAMRNGAPLVLLRPDRRGGTECIDLRSVVKAIDRLDPQTIEIVLETLEGRRFRPGDVAAAIFGLAPQKLRLARFTKLPSAERD